MNHWNFVSILLLKAEDIFLLLFFMSQSMEPSCLIPLLDSLFSPQNFCAASSNMHWYPYSMTNKSRDHDLCKILHNPPKCQPDVCNPCIQGSRILLQTTCKSQVSLVLPQSKPPWQKEQLLELRFSCCFASKKGLNSKVLISLCNTPCRYMVKFIINSEM